MAAPWVIASRWSRCPRLAVVTLAPGVVALRSAPAKSKIQHAPSEYACDWCADAASVPSMAWSEPITSSNNPGSAAPVRRSRRVDHNAGPPEWRQGRDVVAMTSQRSTRATRARPHQPRRTRHRRRRGWRRGGRVCFIEHDQEVGVGLVKVAARLGLVVEAEHSRGGSSARIFRQASRPAFK